MNAEVSDSIEFSVERSAECPVSGQISIKLGNNFEVASLKYTHCREYILEIFCQSTRSHTLRHIQPFGIPFTIPFHRRGIIKMRIPKMKKSLSRMELIFSRRFFFSGVVSCLCSIFPFAERRKITEFVIVDACPRCQHQKGIEPNRSLRT